MLTQFEVGFTSPFLPAGLRSNVFTVAEDAGKRLKSTME